MVKQAFAKVELFLLLAASFDESKAHHGISCQREEVYWRSRASFHQGKFRLSPIVLGVVPEESVRRLLKKCWKAHKSLVSPSFIPDPQNPSPSLTDRSSTSLKMVLEDFTYVFVIGTFFALLDAYNNGASE